MRLMEQIVFYLEEYIDYFRNSEEEWNINLEKVAIYINKNHKKPSEHNNDNKVLAHWITTQLKNYKNKTQIMQNNKIYDKWTEFVEKYKDYFTPLYI